MNNRIKIKHKLRNWRRYPVVTYGFLALSIFMYILMSMNGGSQNPFTLVIFGAKVNELIVFGDWWRLITPMFLHIGLTHIIFNGLVVYFLGAQLEMLIGHFRYFLLYVLSGIMGNAASFAFSNAISAGASTAIFGLFAATIVLGKLYPHRASIQQLSRNYLVLIILNVVLGLFNTGIDNAGHMGGLVGGYLIMYAISSPNVWNNPKKQRIIYGAIFLVVLIILIIIGFVRTGNLIF